ncbi:MAG: glycosyltransferase [Acidobacteriota bacterium]
MAETRIVLDTDRPVAVSSPDHHVPTGTRQDNSRNPVFDEKLAALLPDRRLRVLDLGCSGGAFVKSCHDAGHLAVGLEGSDFSQGRKRAEWATIPDRLFTCDVTAPFTVRAAEDDADEATLLCFDVVTAWEVMEHFATDDLSAVCANVAAHLAPGGIWIMSVNLKECHVDGTHLHQTVESPRWWRRFLEEQGFDLHPELVRWFEPDWVRGSLQNAPGCIHLVATRHGDRPPTPPAAFFDPSPEALLDAAEHFLDEGSAFRDPGSLWYAVSCLDRREGDVPPTPTTQHLRARGLLELGQAEAAAWEARRGLKLDPDDATLSELLERARSGEGPRNAATDDDAQVETDAPPASGRRVLVIHERVPRADASGTDLRLNLLLQALRDRGDEVTLLTRSDDGAAEHAAQVKRLGVELVSPAPGELRDALEPDGDFESWLRSRESPFHAAILFQWWWSGASVSEQYLPQIRRASPQTRIGVLVDELASERGEQHARAEDDRIELERARGLRVRERHALTQCDVVLVLCEEDRARVRALVPSARVGLLRYGLRDLPQHVAGRRARSGLVFVGSGENVVNRRAVTWLVDEIVPALRRRHPDLTLRVVGPEPADGWTKSATDGVDVLGRVDDLAAQLERSLVMVAPIPFGTGLRSKNLAAWSAGLPLVTTPAGAEGLGSRDDEAVLTGRTTEQLVEAVDRLLRDERAWERGSRSALQRADRLHGREALHEDLYHFLEAHAGTAPKPVPADPAGPGLRVLEVLDQRQARDITVRAHAGHLALSRRLLEAGHLDVAQQELRNVFCDLPWQSPETPAFAEVHAGLAEIHVLLGELDEARAALAEAERLAAKAPEPARLEAVATARRAVESGQARPSGETAAVETTEVTTPEPVSPAATVTTTAPPSGAVRRLFRKADQALARQDCVTAARVLTEALRTEDHHPERWAQLGACLLDLGLIDEVTPVVQRTRQVAPTLRAARLVEARWAWELGRRSEALELLDALLTEQPDDARARRFHRDVSMSYLPGGVA